MPLKAFCQQEGRIVTKWLSATNTVSADAMKFLRYLSIFCDMGYPSLPLGLADRSIQKYFISLEAMWPGCAMLFQPTLTFDILLWGDDIYEIAKLSKLGK